MSREIDNQFDKANEEVVEEAPKKKRGRPPGSKNKTPYERGHLLTQDKISELYGRMKDYMSSDQRKYIKGVINGSQDVDPIRELELLLRQCSLMFSEAAIWHLDNQRVNRDIASFADTVRATAKDLFDLRKKQDELNANRETEEKYSVQERDRSIALIDDLMKDI